MHIPKMADVSKNDLEEIRKYLVDYAVELAWDALRRAEDSEELRTEYLTKLYSPLLLTKNDENL